MDKGYGVVFETSYPPPGSLRPIVAERFARPWITLLRGSTQVAASLKKASVSSRRGEEKKIRK